jgi:hypothetical protein
VDKKLAAERIRIQLEKRLAKILGCGVVDLPRLKLGALVHMLFLLLGDTEELGGFNTSMGGILQLLGNEITWDVEPKREEVEASGVVN